MESELKIQNFSMTIWNPRLTKTRKTFKQFKQSEDKKYIALHWSLLFTHSKYCLPDLLVDYNITIFNSMKQFIHYLKNFEQYNQR